MPKNANDLNIKEKKCEDGNFHSCCHEIELSSYYLAWYPLSSQLGKNLNYETMRHFTHDSCIVPLRLSFMAKARKLYLDKKILNQLIHSTYVHDDCWKVCLLGYHISWLRIFSQLNCLIIMILQYFLSSKLGN